MATTTNLTFSLIVPRLSLPHHHHSYELFSVQTQSRRLPRITKTKTKAVGKDLVGDFGARDPFPAEIESGFAEKVLGNVDTEHKILIPNVSALSLAQQECSPVSPVQSPMSVDDAQSLLRKAEEMAEFERTSFGCSSKFEIFTHVVGWRLLDEGGLKLQCSWKLRDFKCGVELVNRIYKVTEATGHFPNIHLEQPNQVIAELWTSSIGGLSMNDFIVAAKIDEIKTSDLVPRKRIWA